MSEFSLRNRLNIADVRQDKIEVNIEGWTVTTTNTLIVNFIRHLGRADRNDSIYKYRVFNLDNSCNHLGAKRKLNILTKPLRNQSRLLFSGYLELGKSNHDGITGRNTYTLKLFLSLNPTRFCVHQNKRTRGGNRFLSPTLLSREIPNNSDDEFSLDGNDNVAISRMAKSNLSSSFYRGMLQTYINEIINYFDAELQTFSYDGFEIRSDRLSFSIPYVENYWDVECEDPTYETNRLKDCFAGLSNSNRVREYRTENDGASLSLICKLRRGENLKIYAKTNRKIRVEIAQKYNKNADLTANRAYEVPTMEGILNFLLESEQSATNQANKYINALYEHLDYTPILRKTPVDFVTFLYSAVGDINLARSILSELVTNGGFPRSYAKNIPSNVITSLKNAGLISYLGKPHSRFVVHRRFRNAVSILNS